MQEGRYWSYQTDLFCIAGTIHVMLFGEYMQVNKKFGVWDIKQKFPRYAIIFSNIFVALRLTKKKSIFVDISTKHYGPMFSRNY